MEVVKEIRLITCERIVYRHGAILSLCVGAVVLTLGGDDIEDGVPDREQVDCEREKVEEGCILPGGKTPQLAEAQGNIALALSTWKKEFRSEYR